MIDPPPSYEAANSRDHWSLIARYIPSRDLCSAALVCRQWHQVFAPQLWGNPASHFGVENDVVYVALTRFKRTLSWARLSTRELTHTLHLPPAHAELYDGPHADWLRHVLERLPRLQVLKTSGLPFFDHAALVMLRRASNPRRVSLSDSLHQAHVDFPLFRLRYLDASRCPNATYIGLTEALRHFPALLYLDLSRTKAARDVKVLSTLGYCRSLRILKLRALALRDEELGALAAVLKTRLRSLDVRDNQLTDKSARILLSNSIMRRSTEPQSAVEALDDPSVLHPDSPPAFGLRFFNWYDGEDLDDRLRTSMAEEFAGRTVIDDSYKSGITHLYIDNNQLTVEGISGLLMSERLCVLDAGTISKATIGPHRVDSLLTPAYEDHEGFSMPGAEKLTPILKNHGSDRLTYLRISHAVVSEDIPVSDLTLGRSELEGSLAVYMPEESVELDTSNEVYELPAREHFQELPTSQSPVELLGDSYFPRDAAFRGDSSFRVELPSRAAPAQPPVPVLTIEAPTPYSPEIRRGSAFAAEPVETSPASTPSSEATFGRASTPNLPVDSTRSSRSSFITAEDRRARLDLRQSDEGWLHPGMLPKLQTLVLTNIPAVSPDIKTTQRLIRFVQDCAEEAQIAKLSAQGAYAVPPGRDRQVAEREFAQSIFALQKIVLEIARTENPMDSRKPTASWRQYPTKSSTEDDDSEAFWTAAGHDFSFFGDEECGIPTMEPGRSLPLATTTEKIAVVSEPLSSLQALAPEDAMTDQYSRGPLFDVVGELTRFRRDRKAVFEAAVARGEPEPMIEGYWPGEISVVRPSHVDETRTGNVDCFGNYFENGYNYR